MAYAEGTTVSPEKTRSEIERLVRNKGANKVGSYYDTDKAVVTFATADRMVKFVIPLPQVSERAMVTKALRLGHRKWGTPTPSEMQRAIEAEERRRWRALLLVIKAKFESVDSAIETFDESFLAHIVTPGGGTIMEEIRAIERGGGQKMLSAPDGTT